MDELDAIFEPHTFLGGYANRMTVLKKATSVAVSKARHRPHGPDPCIVGLEPGEQTALGGPQLAVCATQKVPLLSSALFAGVCGANHERSELGTPSADATKEIVSRVPQLTFRRTVP